MRITGKIANHDRILRDSEKLEQIEATKRQQPRHEPPVDRRVPSRPHGETPGKRDIRRR